MILLVYPIVSVQYSTVQYSTVQYSTVQYSCTVSVGYHLIMDQCNMTLHTTQQMTKGKHRGDALNLQRTTHIYGSPLWAFWRKMPISHHETWLKQKTCAAHCICISKIYPSKSASILILVMREMDYSVFRGQDSTMPFDALDPSHQSISRHGIGCVGETTCVPGLIWSIWYDSNCEYIFYNL